MKSKLKGLSWKEVGIDLASIHYGLGFLLGSGAAIYSEGSIGILYAVSSALGLFSLAIIAKYYRKERVPIWDILGNSYGKIVKELVAFLSGIWMLGVVASQVLGGSYALSVFGIPHTASAVIISLLILVLSLANLKVLSKVFSSMLTFSSIVLLIMLGTQGFSWIYISAIDLLHNMSAITSNDLIGVLLTTVLLTFVGMDFHQFIVESKSDKDAVLGSIFGGIILMILALLVLALVYGSIELNVINGITDNTEVVPTIIKNIGNRISPLVGFMLALPILLVSVGSGSGVTKIVAKTIAEFDVIGKRVRNKKYLNIICVAIAFLLSLSGKSIIDLIVAFYAVYVGTVFIPFLAHLFSAWLKLSKLRAQSMTFTLIFGAVLSIGVLVTSFITDINLYLSTSSLIIFVGFLSTFISLLSFKLVHKLP